MSTGAEGARDPWDVDVGLTLWPCLRAGPVEDSGRVPEVCAR